VSSYVNLKTRRPLRFAAALVVYRALWWPAIVVAAPFVLVAALVDWLSWTGFPAIERVALPIWRGLHGGALAAGNAVLGYDRDSEPRP